MMRTFSRLMITAGCLLSFMQLHGEEGMWIPMLLEKYQIGTMQEAGLRLDAGDIYDINRDCLKDAVVIFNGGCTASIISGEGLLLTNHHCGRSIIQWHSTPEKNYLDNGYWAMSREEELPHPSMSVTFLRYIKEVTTEVMQGIGQGMDPDERTRMLELNSGRIILEATHGTQLEAEVIPFYFGNEYYLFVYEVFWDVRLVGAPPIAIGNFGGDRDNWMWPRHSGDFMLFRVYAGEDNQPATYHPANQPYKPREYLEINASGIREGDFTMILGYPSSTSAYMHSEGIRQLEETRLPLKIALRSARLGILDRLMQASDTLRLRYAVQYYNISNSWKKWQGVLLGLDRKHVVEMKENEERVFREWVEEDGERILKYEEISDRLAQLHGEILPYELVLELLEEAVEPLELFGQVNRMWELMMTGTDPALLRNQVEQFYGSYLLPADRELFGIMMEACFDHMPEPFLPPFLSRAHRKFKGDFQRFAGSAYQKTMFSDPEKVLILCDLYRIDPDRAIDQLLQDPMAIYAAQFADIYREKVASESGRLQEELDLTYRRYMQGLREMSEKRLYADANFTMRLTWGEVGGYEPSDGIQYQYATTLSGAMEKGAADGGEGVYRIPGRLLELYEDKDYGRYGVDGTMPVCFLASNHTSGGNSGSPVLNADGQLIGLNFDRNWEGTMSDYNYDPDLCRNIAVDIRYIFFIVDKFAGAGYLMEEMKINW